MQKKPADLVGNVFKGTITSDLTPTKLTFTFKAGGLVDVLHDGAAFSSPGTYSISADNKQITLAWIFFYSYNSMAALTENCTKINGTASQDFLGNPTITRTITLTKQ